MAPVKKNDKKPAAKTTAAKKTSGTAAKAASTKTAAAKKPAAKTAAVKKPAVKTAATKAPVKKPAVKAAPKAASTKTAATKTTVKAPAPKAAPVKKPAANTAVKAAPKSAAKPAEKKPDDKTAEVLDANVKYRNLFDAYQQGKLPFAHGYIVSSFFHANSAYSIYEIVSYAGVKEIFPSAEGLQFVTGGKKLYVLVEPDTYHLKSVEPVSRAEGDRVPKRFSELETIIAKNQSRIMVAKEPNETFGSFTILKPQGVNFSVVFYQLPDVYDSLTKFFEDSLNRQRKVPQHDAKKASQLVVQIVKKSMGFEGEFKTS